MIPLECQYLNKASLAAAAGSLPEPAKHFTVKRKPKSAALRAEIVQKCKTFPLFFFFKFQLEIRYLYTISIEKNGLNKAMLKYNCNYVMF